MSFTIKDVCLEASSIIDGDIPEAEAIRLANAFISLMGGRAWREASQYYMSASPKKWYSLPADFIRSISVRDTIGVPTGLAVTNAGTAGTTSYGYRVSALNDNGETMACTEIKTTTGNAALNSTDYNALAWDEVDGATSYNVYRTTTGESPATTGLIGNTGDTTLNDTGLAGGGAEVPAEDFTGDEYTNYNIRNRQIKFVTNNNYVLQYTAYPAKLTTAEGATGTPDIHDIFFYPMAKYVAGKYLQADEDPDDPGALRLVAEAIDEMNSALSELEIDNDDFRVEETW